MAKVADLVRMAKIAKTTHKTNFKKVRKTEIADMDKVTGTTRRAIISPIALLSKIKKKDQNLENDF